MLQIFSCLFFSTALFATPNPQSVQPQIEGLLLNDFERAVTSVERYGEPAYEVLQALAFDDRLPMENRWKSLMVLTKLAGHKSLPVLEKALQDRHWFMRSAGLTAIGSVDKKKSVQWAYKKFKSDPALMVRMKAFELLRDKQNNSITELFWHKLNSADSFHQDKSLWIRQDIAYELLQRSRKKDLKRWVDVLHGKDSKLQAIASQALSKLSGQTSLSVESHVSYWKKIYPQSEKL